MQTVAQSGGHSNRPLNGPPSQQVKSSGDVSQNSYATAIGKGRKRERTDQISSLSKRERYFKLDDSEPAFTKKERNMKFDDIFCVADKDGGMPNLAGVDRMIYMMKHEKNDVNRKPSDVTSWRTAMAGIIAATDQEDCLNRFVHLGGLSLLDEWLQEAHKGKIGDNGSPREADKGLEELLLTLLRALEKLPVDLGSLKTCIIGKSVNTLRSHRNLEIQKRARKLVDMWKKRVDTEMQQSGESKVASCQGMLWSGKQLVSDLTSSLPPKCGGNSEAPLKNSGVPGSTAKNVSNGSISLELSKCDVGHMGAGKVASSASSTALLGTKENKTKVSSYSLPDVPCSNSGPLIVNSAVLPNGQVKGVNPILKEEEKGFSTTSLQGKTGIHGSRSLGNCGSNNVVAGSATGSKEAGLGRHLVWSRNTSTEKIGSGDSGLDKGSLEGNIAEMLNNHRLIVKIPNSARSPACSGNGVSVPCLRAPSSRSSSPNTSEKHGNSAADDATNSKTRMQTPVSSPGGIPGTERELVMSKAGSSGDHDSKQEGCDSHKAQECNHSEAPCISLDTANTNSCRSHTDNGDAKVAEAVTLSSRVLANNSFRQSDSSSLDLAAIGINLLATVAANESSMSDTTASVVVSDNTESDTSILEADMARVHIAVSFRRSEKVDRESTTAFSKEHHEEAESLMISPCSSLEMESKHECEFDRKVGSGGQNTESRFAVAVLPEGEIKVADPPTPKNTFIDDCGSDKLCGVSVSGECPSVEDGVSDEKEGDTRTDIEIGHVSFAKRENNSQHESDVSLRLTEEDALEVARQVAKEVEQEMESLGKSSPEIESFDMNSVHGLKTTEDTDTTSGMQHSQKPLDSIEDTGRGEEFANQAFSGVAAHYFEYVCLNLNSGVNEKMVQSLDVEGSNQMLENSSYLNSGFKDEIKSANAYSHPSSPRSQTTSSFVVSAQQVLRPVARNSHHGGVFIAEERSKVVTVSDNVFKAGDAVERRDFDLNEGFVEEVSPEDTVNSYVPTKNMAAISSSGLAVPIAIVAATKGPFLPLSCPLQSKGDFCWKGSAATSAFRPAEPRYTPEKLSSFTEKLGSDVVCASNGKHSRPFLDFDLNIADERTFDDDANAAVPLTSRTSFYSSMLNSSTALSHTALCGDVCGTDKAGGNCEVSIRPNLDLNRVDETENGTMPADYFKVQQGTGFYNSGKVSSITGKNTMLDIDLNGPSVDVDEPTPHGNFVSPVNTTPLPISGLRLNRDITSDRWSQAKNFSTVTGPPFTSLKHGQLYPVTSAQSFLSAGPGTSSSFLNTATSSNPFHCDIYRPGTPTFSSSLIPYPMPPTNAFPYAGFPFGFSAASFPPVSASVMDSSVLPSFPAMSSQMLNCSSVMPSHMRPYLLGVTDVMGSTGDYVWGRPSLDLNAGPDSVEGDSKEGRASVRQSSAFGSSDDPRMFSYQVIEAGDALKRKQPDGGWCMQGPMSKQQTWQ